MYIYIHIYMYTAAIVFFVGLAVRDAAAEGQRT